MSITVTFSSLADFTAFVALIRNEHLDADHIRALTHKLQASTAALADAEHADAGSPPASKKGV